MQNALVDTQNKGGGETKKDKIEENELKKGEEVLVVKKAALPLGHCNFSFLWVYLLVCQGLFKRNVRRIIIDFLILIMRLMIVIWRWT